MKKVVLIMATLVAIAGLVYADAGITLGAWGRGIYLPIASGGGSDLYTKDLSSWGPQGGRIGFTISGNSQNVGFQADMRVEQGAANLGDQQKIWVKPIDMIKVQFGKVYDDTVRGSGSFGAFNWLRYGGMVGDGLVFARVGETPVTANGGEAGVNFELSIAPMDGLYIYAAVGGNGTDLTSQTGVYKAPDIFKNGQYGAGYTIAGIGMIRAQVCGYTPGVADNAFNIIQGAFKLTAVQGLSADIGGYYCLDQDKATTAGKVPTGLALAGSYGMGALSLNLEVNLGIPKTGDMKLEGGIGAGYTIDQTNGIGVEGAVNYQNKAYSGLDNGAIGILVGVTKGFGNGVCGIGFECTTGSFATNWGTELVPGDASTKADALKWCVPVRVEYWF
jgi:hypothetical protein